MTKTYRLLAAIVAVLSMSLACRISFAEDPPEQISDCSSDVETRQEVEKLTSRGFSKEVITESCREVEQWADGDTSRLESMAILHSLGYSVRERHNVLYRNWSLGDYLVRSYRKHKRLRIIGTVLMIAGIPLIVSGAVFLSKFKDEGGSDDDGTMESAAAGFQIWIMRAAGTLFVVLGSLMEVGGFTLILAGSRNSERFQAPRELWDRRDNEAIEAWYLDNYSPVKDKNRDQNALARSSFQFNITPQISRSGAGITLRLSF